MRKKDITLTVNEWMVKLEEDNIILQTENATLKAEKKLLLD